MGESVAYIRHPGPIVPVRVKTTVPPGAALAGCASAIHTTGSASGSCPNATVGARRAARKTVSRRRMREDSSSVGCGAVLTGDTKTAGRSVPARRNNERPAGGVA